MHRWLLPLEPPRPRPIDRGILAQQSDVRCKRGRLGVIMIAPSEVSSSPALRGARLPSNERGRPPEGVRLPPNNLRQNPLERSALRLTPSLSASSSWCRRRHSRTRSSYAADQSISHTRRATTTATTTMPSTSLTFLLFRRLGGLGPMSIAKSPLSLQPKERPPPAALAGRV